MSLIDRFLFYGFIILLFSCDPLNESSSSAQKLRGEIVYPEISIEIGDIAEFPFDENTISIPFSTISNIVRYEVFPTFPDGITLENGIIKIGSEVKLKQQEKKKISCKNDY